MSSTFGVTLFRISRLVQGKTHKNEGRSIPPGVEGADNLCDLLVFVKDACTSPKRCHQAWPGASCGWLVFVDESSEDAAASDPVGMCGEWDHVVMIFGGA